jgi:hypothetical protein
MVLAKDCIFIGLAASFIALTRPNAGMLSMPINIFENRRA